MKSPSAVSQALAALAEKIKVAGTTSEGRALGQRLLVLRKGTRHMERPGDEREPLCDRSPLTSSTPF